MNTNKTKSQSSRIRRRNKVGFEGRGSHVGMNPNHVYGDYTNPIDNHKEDNKNNTHEAGIALAKKYGFRHPGSKPMKKLMKIIHDNCSGEPKTIIDKAEEALERSIKD